MVTTRDTRLRVLITDYMGDNTQLEQEILGSAGIETIVAPDKNPQTWITDARNIERDWALKANARDARGTAGALALMKIAALKGHLQEAEHWASVAPTSSRGSTSQKWMQLVSAKEIARGPSRETARSILTNLWVDDGYEPARTALLEVFGSAPDRPTTAVQ